jgi:hypothetical protein
VSPMYRRTRRSTADRPVARPGPGRRAGRRGRCRAIGSGPSRRGANPDLAPGRPARRRPSSRGRRRRRSTWRAAVLDVRLPHAPTPYGLRHDWGLT